MPPAKQSHRAIGTIAVMAALCAVGLQSAQAQQAGVTDPYTDLSQYLLVGNQPVPRAVAATPGAPALSSTISQFGQNNVATAALVGSGNVTIQTQTGVGNSSTVSLDGTQNAVTTTQIGNANTTSISVVGGDNSISNLQSGSGLSYHLQVVGTAPPISVQQFGKK